jgi:hypothetical protein
MTTDDVSRFTGYSLGRLSSSQCQRPTAQTAWGRELEARWSGEPLARVAVPTQTEIHPALAAYQTELAARGNRRLYLLSRHLVKGSALRTESLKC